MRLDRLLSRQSNCVAICPAPPACACSADEECVQYNRNCDICATVKCVPKSQGSSGSSSGVSKGALAGGVVGALIFLVAVIGLYLWYRRSQRAFKVPEEKRDIPAAAEDVLNRPDPTEKPVQQPTPQQNTVRVYSISSNTTIDLDPESQQDSRRSARGSAQSNPFTDTHSIQTVGTEGSQGTNVIPIALVSQESDLYSHSAPHSPARPVRSPDLNLDHANVSSNNSLRPPYAPSQVSGISGFSAVSSRNSYSSNASYSSDFLNEAPTIITPTRGTVRQLMGVVKAEVINAPGSRSTADGTKSSLTARPSIRSPLAASSFGPTDVLVEGRESQALSLNGDPFRDQHASTNLSTATEHGSTLPSNSSIISDWVPDEPNAPWSHGPSSRPASVSTQAASIADIGNATRVNVGLNGLSGGYATATTTPQTAAFPKSPFRQTMGRLVTPTTGVSDIMEEHQQYAMAQAQAQSGRRTSGSSVMSAASTRADSILESFPFVPPSPISDRPVRSPPASPLAQQAFTNVVTKQAPSAEKSKTDDLVPAPSRKMLGLSTSSQFSTASSGLGSFTFQIDSENGETQRPPVPVATSGGAAVPSSFKVARHRASLDTLALTSDLASYPLGFDAFAASKKA